MEIKTTDEICYYLNDDTMKDFKWVSLEDLKEWLDNIDTDLTKEMLLDKLRGD